MKGDTVKIVHVSKMKAFKWNMGMEKEEVKNIIDTFPATCNTIARPDQSIKEVCKPRDSLS